MSRKHNAKHRRARSHYPDRLIRRGIKKRSDVAMPDLDELRRSAGLKTAPVVISQPGTPEPRKHR